MIDFDPSKHLTLTPAVGEETVYTDWIVPSEQAITHALVTGENPVGALSDAQSTALYPFFESLRFFRQKTEEGRFKISRVWLGEPRRDHRDWSKTAIEYPLRYAIHLINPDGAEQTRLMLDMIGGRSFRDSPLLGAIRFDGDATDLMGEGCRLMAAGDYEHGLPLYEFRHQTPCGMKQWKENLTMPHWDGKFRPGMKLLVHAEQGYGDTLQFARYLPWLNDFDADFLCFPCLCELFKTLNFKGKIFSALDPDKTYDYHVPLCSLPLATDPTMGELPHAPYIRSDANKYWHWRERVGREGYRVGICWAGNQIHPNNTTRTKTIETVINACPKGARLFSLQKGDAAEQLKLLPSEIKVENLTAELHDWSDTAAFVDNMDLIVTVDTAVAHLAGAIGRPVKLIVGENAEWRWGDEGDRTRWYSSMVLDRLRAVRH